MGWNIGLRVSGFFSGAAGAVGNIAGGVADLAVDGARIFNKDIKETNFSRNLGDSWKEGTSMDTSKMTDEQREIYEGWQKGGEMTVKTAAVVGAAAAVVITAPVSGTVALAAAGAAGGATFLAANPDHADQFVHGVGNAATLIKENPARAATVAWDGLQNGLGDGLGFVGGLVTGGVGGVAGLALDVGNLGLRAVSLNNWGRKDGSFTWDMGKGGFQFGHWGVHGIVKTVFFDNIVDRALNGIGSITGLGTYDRVPTLDQPGEGFLHGTTSFVGSLFGAAAGMKMLKVGGAALMARLGGSSSTAAAAAETSAAANTAAAGQRLSMLDAKAIFRNSNMNLVDKVEALVQGGRTDLAEKAVRLARTSGADSLPMSALRNSGQLSDAFLAEMSTAQSAASRSLFGIGRMREAFAARASYAVRYPGAAAADAGVATLKGAGKTAWYAARHPVQASVAVGTVSATVPAVGNFVGSRINDAGEFIDTHVDGPIGDFAGVTLRETGLLLAHEKGDENIRRSREESGADEDNMFASWGLGPMFDKAAGMMHDNPLLWGSVFGIGAFMVGSVGSSFVPMMDRFASIIGLALAAVTLVSLYNKGQELADEAPRTSEPTSDNQIAFDNSARNRRLLPAPAAGGDAPALVPA